MSPRAAPMRPASYPPLAALVALVAVAAPARANGRYPEAGQIVTSPDDPAHVLVRATFGMLDSRDDGGTWGWVCEGAVGFQGVEDPPVAIAAGDRVLAGLSNGLVTSADRGCTWERAAGALGTQRVLDVAVQAADPAHAVAVSVSYVPSRAFLVWTSDDGGATWAKTPAPLPADVTYVATIDVAATDAKRLWASGSAGSPVDGVLLRSDDGGASWTTIALGTGSDIPYVAGVDPTDPDRAWLRVDGASDSLLRTDDAGATFTSVLEYPGALLGFAVSPDGAQIAVSGPAPMGGAPLGVQVSPATGVPAFTQRSALGARCLAWTAGALWACADEKADGLTVGRSADEGATFAAALHLANLSPLACPAATPVATECAAAWPVVAGQLGIDAGAPLADAGDAGGNDAHDGSDADAGDGDAAVDAAGAGGPGASAGATTESGAGCACAARRPADGCAAGPIVGAAIAAWLVRRRRARFRDRAR